MGCCCAMPRFFVDKSSISDGKAVICGEDAKHISLSLRSKPGEHFSLCDKEGTDYECTVLSISKAEVVLNVDEVKKNESEPSVFVTLYQALVKSDKFDTVVQKSVELGVGRIVPVVMERCISRPDEAGLSKKIERWNKISKEAAMQSGRGIVPEVMPAVDYKEALNQMKQNDISFVCYENEPHVSIEKIAANKKESADSASLLVGPEGGISEKEAKLAEADGIPLASLGKRILRTETAPLCALSCLMLVTGNLE